MKNVFHLFVALLIVPAALLAVTQPETDLSKISEPPMDAPTGQKHERVQIGLWTEKPVYVGTEIRDVWMLARRDGDSATTIGVGGSLYKNSFLYITSNKKEVAKLPLHGGVDGTVNPIRKAGGLSGQLAMLPSGTYQLVWKTDTHESNTITIKIEKGKDAESAFSLGMLRSVEGPGLEPDPSEAFRWFRKAAELGYVDAQYQLGRYYMGGWGVEKNIPEAISWWHRAAEAGSADAQSMMTLLLEVGEVLKPDPALAFRLFESAANKGDATGMAGVARAYYSGSGVETNYVKAAEWNEKAAALGWVEAQTSLATQYALGQGVEQDMKKALELAHQAADEGSVQAMKLLSWIYGEGGDGVEVDYRKSAVWLRKSIEHSSGAAE